MRQHPIPQNVLDIEFKLFTKFTLKEFAYLAVGVSIGGIFLYLSTKGDIPGIIGVPAFALFSGAGAFLALVPINDQNADTYIVNYFTAINRPTQRVWLNKTMKSERVKPQLQNTQIVDGNSGIGKGKVIGGAKIPEAQKMQVFVENPGDDILQEDTNVTSTQTDTVNKEQQVPNIPEGMLTINEENITRYQFNIKSLDKLPGNINIWLCTKENQPIPNVNAYLKDLQGKILYANKTGPNGYFLTNKNFPPGIYIIEFENLPTGSLKMRLMLTENISKLPLKIQIG